MTRRSITDTLRSALLLGSIVTLASACAPDTGFDESEEWEQSAEAEGALRVCADGPTTDGIDVSYWQETIDWQAVAATNVKFAFVRAAYGSTFADPKFGQNWAGAKSAGLVRGAYQYFRPGEDPAEQAQVFLAQFGSDPIGPGDLPAVLDVEQTDGVSNATVRQRMQTWLDIVEQATGKRPIVYTAAFMQNTVGAGFSSYPLWAANYTTNCPLMPSGWNDWHFWQYTEKGKVAGVQGNVDRNRFNGSLSDLLAFAGASSTPTPPSDPSTPSDPTNPSDPPAPPAPPDPAGAPTNLSPKDGSSVQTDYVTMSSNTVSGASAYQFDIDYYKPGTGWKPYYEYTTAGPHKTFYPAWDAAYRFRMRAKRNGSWRTYSNFRTFTFGSATMP